MSLTIVASKTFVKQACTFGAERMGPLKPQIHTFLATGMSKPPTRLSHKATGALAYTDRFKEITAYQSPGESLLNWGALRPE